MDKREDFVDAQLGTREKRIYTINTYVNQDGFKVEKHVPMDGDEKDRTFYGFYLVNTEIGPIDRYFKFHEETDVEECFENFKPMAEADAKKLADTMKAEAERLDAEADASVDAAVPPPPGSEPQTERDTEVLDSEGCPI